MIKKTIIYIFIYVLSIFLMTPLLHAQKKSEWTPLFNQKAKDVQGHKVEEKKEEAVFLSQGASYEEYYLMIREEINDIVRKEGSPGIEGEVEVQFTLNRDGFITRGPVVLNKPDLRLVRSAVNCVRKVVPFPPFPNSLDKDEAQFYVVVRYK